MKRSYEKPVLTKRDQLVAITAGDKASPFNDKDKDHDLS